MSLFRPIFCSRLPIAFFLGVLDMLEASPQHGGFVEVQAALRASEVGSCARHKLSLEDSR